MIELIRISEWTFSKHAKTSEQSNHHRLLKSFDYINHNLLLVKLAAYGTTNDLLHLLRFYLTEGIQDVNINDKAKGKAPYFTRVARNSLD